MKGTVFIAVILLPLVLLLSPGEKRPSPQEQNVVEVVTRGQAGVIRYYNDNAEILTYEQMQRMFCQAKANLVIIEEKIDELKKKE